MKKTEDDMKKELDDWMKDNPFQIDDISLMGIEERKNNT